MSEQKMKRVDEMVQQLLPELLGPVRKFLLKAQQDEELQEAFLAALHCAGVVIGKTDSSALQFGAPPQSVMTVVQTSMMAGRKEPFFRPPTIVQGKN